MRHGVGLRRSREHQRREFRGLRPRCRPEAGAPAPRGETPRLSQPRRRQPKRGRRDALRPRESRCATELGCGAAGNISDGSFAAYGHDAGRRPALLQREAKLPDSVSLDGVNPNGDGAALFVRLSRVAPRSWAAAQQGTSATGVSRPVAGAPAPRGETPRLSQPRRRQPKRGRRDALRSPESRCATELDCGAAGNISDGSFAACGRDAGRRPALLHREAKLPDSVSLDGVNPNGDGATLFVRLSRVVPRSWAAAQQGTSATGVSRPEAGAPTGPPSLRWLIPEREKMAANFVRCLRDRGESVKGGHPPFHNKKTPNRNSPPRALARKGVSVRGAKRRAVGERGASHRSQRRCLRTAPGGAPRSPTACPLRACSRRCSSAGSGRAR